MNIHRLSRMGFTIVEILVVVVIIGLLAAMAIPAFNKVRETSQGKACVNNLRQIVSAKDQYFLENGGQPSVPLVLLIDPDGYIKAMPTCPLGENNYPASLTPDAQPVCSSGEAAHELPSA